MNPALELVSVTAGYGDVPIVREFSARLQAGTITTLIGGNGAGKSTLLKILSSDHPPELTKCNSD